MVSAVAICHENGVTHRDLKLENVMLDENWELKIIDFGLAAPTEGRDGSGYLKTTLGTKGYMAPEQHLGRLYQGEHVDLFAMGVILFVMISMHPPFNEAIPQDQFYVALASKNYEAFWRKHSQNKPEGDAFYSPEFRDLFQQMTELDPEKRITIAQVEAHPWITKECTVSSQSANIIFQERLDTLNKKVEEQSHQSVISAQSSQQEPIKASYRASGEMRTEIKHDLSKYESRIKNYSTLFKITNQIVLNEDPEVVFNYLVKTLKDNYDETIVGFNSHDPNMCNEELMKLNFNMAGKSNTNTDWNLKMKI